MKLYDFELAPNPRRVRIFLAEKGVEIPSVQVNTREREQFSEAFRAVNSRSVVPVLELDDGTCIGESVAICRYIEEIHPEPPLMGRDAKDRAIVEMWNRRAELECYQPTGEAVRNSAPMFVDRGLPGVTGGVPQIPELVARGKQSLTRFLERLDTHLANSAFIAGDAFTIADITTLVALDFSARADYEMPAGLDNVERWRASVSSRPSASA